MNLSAVRHSSFYPFVQPLARNSADILLHTAPKDVDRCAVVWWKRSEPGLRHTEGMSLRYGVKNSDQWRANLVFPEQAHYIKYYFLLRDFDGLTVLFTSRGVVPLDPEKDEDLRLIRAMDTCSVPDGETPSAENGCFEILQINETDILSVPTWAIGAVYYQIFPERFAKDVDRSRTLDGTQALDPWDAEPTRDNYLGGTLNGITSRLGYLADLGVECLYLNPVFRGDFNHKYATTDYFSIDPMFGTQDDLIRLTDTAHSLGIRVVLDGVFNHVGIHFAPFADWLEKGSSSAFAGWFYPGEQPARIDERCYECVGDYAYMPRLRGCCPEVRKFVREVLLYWLRVAHIDGWRFDVADELDRHAVSGWCEAIKAEFPDAVLIAETWGDATRMVSPDSMDCAMNYLFRDAMVDYFAHRTIHESDLAHRLSAMLARYPDQTNLAMYNCLGSHDTPRFLTECGGNKATLKLAMAFQMLFPGAPAVYYGDEAGMTGENDPGCRGGMVWEKADRELRDWEAEWIHLRKQQPLLRHGGYRMVLADDKQHLFAFERFDRDHSLLAVFNMDNKPHSTDFAGRAESVDVSPLSVKIINL